jgi:hypothetical protein
MLNSPSSKVPTPGAVGDRKGKPATTSRKANIEDKDDDDEKFLEFSGKETKPMQLEFYNQEARKET